MAKSSIFISVYLSSKGLGILDIFQFVAPDYIPVWYRSEKNQNPRSRSWIVFSLNSLILREQSNAVFWKWKESKVAQSCPTLCDPLDHSLPGSSVHGIFQTRELEWVAISPGDLLAKDSLGSHFLSVPVPMKENLSPVKPTSLLFLREVVGE